jgi:hypothetical protein
VVSGEGSRSRLVLCLRSADQFVNDDGVCLWGSGGGRWQQWAGWSLYSLTLALALALALALGT